MLTFFYSSRAQSARVTNVFLGDDGGIEKVILSLSLPPSLLDFYKAIAKENKILRFMLISFISIVLAQSKIEGACKVANYFCRNVANSSPRKHLRQTCSTGSTDALKT